MGSDNNNYVDDIASAMIMRRREGHSLTSSMASPLFNNVSHEDKKTILRKYLEEALLPENSQNTSARYLDAAKKGAMAQSLGTVSALIPASAAIMYQVHKSLGDREVFNKVISNPKLFPVMGAAALATGIVGGVRGAITAYLFNKANQKNENTLRSLTTGSDPALIAKMMASAVPTPNPILGAIANIPVKYVHEEGAATMFDIIPEALGNNPNDPNNIH